MLVPWSEEHVYVRISVIILGVMQRKVKKKNYSLVTKVLFIQTHRVFALCLNIHNAYL